MILYDFECTECGKVFEDFVDNSSILVVKCKICSKKAKRIFPQKSPSFKLVYNPKTDMVDWNGNRTRYYDEYNKMKKEGKNPRIPALDGDA